VASEVELWAKGSRRKWHCRTLDPFPAFPFPSAHFHLRERQQQSENEMTRNEWQSKRLHEKLSWSMALGLVGDL